MLLLDYFFTNFYFYNTSIFYYYCPIKIVVFRIAAGERNVLTVLH